MLLGATFWRARFVAVAWNGIGRSGGRCKRRVLPPGKRKKLDPVGML
ncbi:MAG: hypothetical protein WDN50_06460 [Bradyrhizobium sp.]